MMRMHVLAPAVVLVLATAVAAPADAGRPLVWPLVDDAGTQAWDSTQSACAAAFADISATGTQLVLSDGDDGGAVIALTEPFQLYGEELSSLVVSANGYLAATGSLLRDSGGDFSDDCPLPAIPEPGPAATGRILALHDDLAAGATGQVFQQHFASCPRSSEAVGDESCTVVQWDQWASLDGGTTFDLQVVLYHSSFEVVSQYRGVVPADATVGLQAADASTALAPTCAGAGLPAGPHALCFFDRRFPPGGPIHDLGVEIDQAPATVSTGDTVQLVLSVANAGPSPVADAAVTSVLTGGSTCTWTCTPDSGTDCTSGPVNGQVADAVSLPPDTVITYLVDCVLGSSLPDPLVLSISVEPPALGDDPVLGDNTETATMTVTDALFADDFESGGSTAWSATTP